MYIYSCVLITLTLLLRRANAPTHVSNVINYYELSDDMFVSEEHIRNIGDYIETMQKISQMLGDEIYQFTFGINFALFVFLKKYVLILFEAL